MKGEGKKCVFHLDHPIATWHASCVIGGKCHLNLTSSVCLNRSTRTLTYMFVAPHTNITMMMIRRGARRSAALALGRFSSHSRGIHASCIRLGDALDMVDTFARRHCKFIIAYHHTHHVILKMYIYVLCNHHQEVMMRHVSSRRLGPTVITIILTCVYFLTPTYIQWAHRKKKPRPCFPPLALIPWMPS